MTDGPTTEGSIVGYLRLNTSDWKEKLDEASAQARELPNPDIRINVDSADAIAKLEAIRAAESRMGGVNVGASGAGKLDEVTLAQKRLTAAMSAADSAYARAQLAAMRLDEVENKHGRTELQLASAVYANSEAQKRLTAANEKAILAEEALAHAQRAAADGALEQAAATDTAAASASGGARNVGLMAGALAALVPLIGPLAAAAGGLAGGLAGMGAAGVLAVFGIKNAMAAGTATGQQYTTELAGLKNEFDQLANTAAVAVLGDFQKAADTIAAAMPNLNGEIAQFSNILGGATASTLDGIITSFQILNPLFIEGADLIAQVAAGFDQWSQDGGMQAFATYAEHELPIVFHTIGQLSDAIVQLATDLTPTGNAMLGVLSDAAQLAKGLMWLQTESDSLTKSWEKANKNFQDNPILGSLVQIFEEASNPIQAFNKHAGDLGTLLGMVGGTSQATAPKIAKSTQSIGDLTKATADAQTALSLFNQQLLGLGQTNLSASQSTIQYDQSVADATATIAKNGATLDLNTQAGRDNMSALNGMASNAVTLIGAQQKAGASADSLSSQMATAREAFIKAAMAAGDTRDAASKLADQYGLIPKNVSTAFTTSGAQAAVAAADEIQAAYDKISRQITIKVNSIISNAASNPGGMGLGTGGNGKAGGGFITEYHDTGGWAGMFQPHGTDTVPTMLTPREFVVKQASAAYSPPFLKAYNDNPAAALNAVRQSGHQQPSVTHVWNLYGVNDVTQLSQQMAARQSQLTT